MNRRKFLTFLGLGAVGGKRAAAQAAEVLTAQMNLGALDAAVGRKVAGTRRYLGDDSDFRYGEGASEDEMTRVQNLRLFGLPDWIVERWNEDADDVDTLDPDLASMKSFSLSAKLSMQRDRNRKRAVEQYWQRRDRDRARHFWEKLNGHFPW